MKFSVLLGLIAICCAARAQVIQEKDYPTNKLRCHYVELNAAPGPDSFALPFSHIQLMDLRPDTSKYGYFRGALGAEQYKYCFKQGAHAELTGFVNTYITNNADASRQDYVLMCLRRLWITRDDTVVITKAVSRNRIRILLKADFYLYSNNSFHPLYRFDSLISRESVRRVYAKGLVEEALEAALQKLKRMDYERAANARSITKEDITAYYERLHHIPALNANKIAKGVYRTFEEFKQNLPSDTAFEIKFESLADHLYVKDKNGNQYLEHKVWGVSDGKNAYIRLNQNFFQLFRQQNTWELYATDFNEWYLGGRPGGAAMAPTAGAGLASAAVGEALSNVRVMSKKVTAYQLDLETGEVF